MFTVRPIRLAAFLGLVVAPLEAATTVTNLRCEYKINPIGIDVPQPRLSWWIESDVRGQVQTAYQILVASTEALLKAGAGDLWDSGEVRSDRSIHIAYNGKPLSSRQRAWWTVRVWDKNGNPTSFAPAAFWEAGLLKPDDWAASWIEHTTAPDPSGGIQGGFWIWHPEGNPAASAPAGERFFRRSFEIPAGKKIAKASILITVDDRFALFVNGREVHRFAEKDGWKKVQRVDLAERLVPGRNVVAVEAVNESVSPAGLLARIAIDPEGEPPIRIASDAAWKSSRIRADGWEQAGFDDTGWAPAKECAPNGKGPWGDLGETAAGPPPYFRRTLTVSKNVRSARLYATALGLYEFRLNGKRVGDVVLAPEWTDYNTRIQYQTYDVTGLLHPGENVLGAILGDGWYCGHVGLGGRNRYGKQAALLGQLIVDYADGTSETIGTDAAWRASAGPLLEADLLDGTVYDARREMPGWDRPGFDASTWKPAIVREATTVRGKLEAQVGPPVRKLEELPAKRLSEPKPGCWTFDLGQNMVGHVRLKIRAPAGTKVTLRFAEMLNPDGSIYTANLRGARCTDAYICKGGGEEIWEPVFTFHGFRYVEVTGLPARPTLDTVTGIVVGSDIPVTGRFECSSAAINQLQHNIFWGQRGNYLSIPTDCPQRDERLGWMGDAQVFIRTAAFNNEVASFFTKWLVDVDDAQQPDGAFPDVAPRVAVSAGTAAWGDAGVICPWTIYLAYGDLRILERHYPAMTKWVEYCRRTSNGLIREKGGNNYGDWLSINANTPIEVLTTAYFAYSTDLVARAAAVLGREEDARAYRALFNQIKSAFNARFVDAEGHVHGRTQTCYLMALKFNLLDPDRQDLAVRHLIEDIRARKNHLSTGFVGVSYLLPTLTLFGHTDLAHTLLANDTFPSWLFSVKHGATTIWERWDGWTPDKGFQDPGMNSFNHYAFGSCGEWMYETVAGIAFDPDRPGYKHILMRPSPGGGLTYARARLDSMHGRIASDWKIEENHFVWNVTIPANTTARLVVPAGDPSQIREGGIPASQSKSLRFIETRSKTCHYEAEAGTYQISAPLAAGN